MGKERIMDQFKPMQGELDVEAKARREFLKRIGKAGATAPAVALLLAANVKSASAVPQQYGGGGCGGGEI